MNSVPQQAATAASSIAGHLASPPALTRIPLLRQRIQKERASLQSSLSVRAKEQVDSVREGLQGLKNVRFPSFPLVSAPRSILAFQAKNAIESIKENMKEVERSMGDPQGHVEGFGKLSEVNNSTFPCRVTPRADSYHSPRSPSSIDDSSPPSTWSLR